MCIFGEKSKKASKKNFSEKCHFSLLNPHFSQKKYSVLRFFAKNTAKVSAFCPLFVRFFEKIIFMISKNGVNWHKKWCFPVKKWWFFDKK